MSEYITEWVSHNIEDPFVREEIVRCRDCKRCMAYAQTVYCDRFAHELPEVTLNGFCAWGEKAVKDESDED